MKDSSSDHITYFQSSDVQVLWSSHHLFCPLALLSVIRGLEVAAVPWMSDLWSSCWNFFVVTGSSGWILSSAVTLAAVLIWLIDTILFKAPRSLSVSFGLQPLFLSADDILPWYVYVATTLGTAALDKPNEVAVVLQMLQLNKRTPTICPLWKSDKSPILQYFHTNYY